MNRLVVVSNRVPALKHQAAKPGGLAVGLGAALKKRGGLWFGWSGQLADRPSAQSVIAQTGPFALATFDLTAQQHDGFYAGFANRCLWPVLHGRTDLLCFEEAERAAYAAVNRDIASLLRPWLQPGDTIWVHDYHLIPLAQELRRLGVRAPIGFFLHVPFPQPDVLAALPGHRELMRSLAACDLIGLQTAHDVFNFRLYVAQQLGGATHLDGSASVANRRFAVGNFPIGIDAAAYRSQAELFPIDHREQPASCFGGQLGIVGADRLDYTKGLGHRLRAFERLLSSHSHLHGRTVLVQIAAPSRQCVPEYEDLAGELEALSGTINARYSSVDWTPVRYINRNFRRAALAALFRASRVGLVTPLRDGMNLVAKEYVAAQDGDDPGVLVLSQFAGAAERLQAALIVNPYDVGGMAQALAQALEMPLAERRARWRILMEEVETNSVHRWADTFLDALGAAARKRPQPPVPFARPGLAAAAYRLPSPAAAAPEHPDPPRPAKVA